jgi:hypothetical protein
MKKEASSWDENQEEDSSSHLWEGYSQVFIQDALLPCIRMYLLIYIYFTNVQYKQ